MHGTNVFCLHRRSGGSCRLQSHTTLRARAWIGLAHLGIHRTDVGSVLCLINRRCLWRRVCVPLAARSMSRRGLLEALLGVLFKFYQTVRAAKIIGLAVVDVTSRSAIGLHIHAANRINHLVSSLSGK